jgi:Zn-dependent oligopeptidase
MKQLEVIASILVLLISINVYAQKKSIINPLLVHSNSPVDYTSITTGTIRNATSTFLAEQAERISKMTAIPAEKRTVSNTLMAFDEIEYETVNLRSQLALIFDTFTDETLRAEANNALQQVSAYYTNLYLNESLYKVLRAFATSPAARKLLSAQKKYLQETIFSFEKNGMKLDTVARQDLRKINEKIAQLTNQFNKNIAESIDSLEFSEMELQGVPQNISAAWKQANGRYVVYINSPNYQDVLKYAVEDKTRRAFYMSYMNRAYPPNITTLDSLLYYRQALANKLGFRSFAEYSLIDRMAGKPAPVWNFLNNLVEKSKPITAAYLAEMRKLKQALAPHLPDTIYAWDYPFYSNKLVEQKYDLNAAVLEEYFEYDNTLKGMFTVYEKLLDIHIREVHNIPVWHKTVRSFELFKDGKRVGRFYLDMFPRPGKYTHYKAPSITLYRKSDGGEVLPNTAILFNLPEKGPGQPALLSVYNLSTLFHEFGHVIHWQLMRPEIASQSLHAIKRDFAEAPSQFLENWIYEYDALKLFARHYKTGQILPESLFKKMKQSQVDANGLAIASRLSNSLIDFTFHDKYDSIQGKSLTSVSESLHMVRQIPFVEGSHWICSYPHLGSYPTYVYGYLWAEVFAHDLFTVFEKNGVMDTKTGIRYRKEILEKGASVHEMDMLRNFLGREPNSDAFIKSLGLH